LFNSDGVVLGEIERQDAFSESRSHSVPGQIEHPPENIGVRFGAKCVGCHSVISVRRRAPERIRSTLCRLHVNRIVH
jgi:hypothetical protein